MLLGGTTHGVRPGVRPQAARPRATCSRLKVRVRQSALCGCACMLNWGGWRKGVPHVRRTCVSAAAAAALFLCMGLAMRRASSGFHAGSRV